jgi:hypothetical protein
MVIPPERKRFQYQNVDEDYGDEYTPFLHFSEGILLGNNDREN